MSNIRNVILIGAAASLCSCGKRHGNPDAREGGHQAAKSAQAQPDQDRGAKSLDVASLAELAKGIPEDGGDREACQSLIGELKKSLHETGDYPGVIKVLKELPHAVQIQSLYEFRGVTSPLKAEDELGGRLLLVTGITGIEARSNGVVPEFFAGSSALLPELRRTGLKNPANQAMLGPVYQDLARLRPDAVLGELEQDRALWDTGPATERVMESLLASDPRNTGTMLQALASSPTKDSAIAALCRWMKAHGEAEGIPAWIGLVGDGKLKEQLLEAYPGSGTGK